MSQRSLGHVALMYESHVSLIYEFTLVSCMRIHETYMAHTLDMAVFDPLDQCIIHETYMTHT